MTDILWLLALSASGIAAAAVVAALRRAWQEGLYASLRKRAERLALEADLAGIALPSRTAAALAIAAPLVSSALSFVRKRRMARADRQLPDALALLANALKAGLALPQALEMASTELPAPIGAEFRRALAHVKLGRTVEEALSVLARRLPTDDVGLVVQSIEVLRRTGGNLVETFGTLAQTVESRLRVEERIRVLTAQGAAQGAMLLAMPWLLSAGLAAVAPEYLSPLLTTRLGLMLIAVGVVMEGVGAMWLRRIAVIRV